MKKIKVCSIILTVLSVIGICLSIIKLIAQYNGFAILKHSGGAEGTCRCMEAVHEEP